MFEETTGQPVAEDTLQVTSFSNATAFETEEGLVLVDTGLPMQATGMAAELREWSEVPIHTAIYTHGHMDHAFALGRYLQDDQDSPEVIAHERMPDRFDRYERTAALERGRRCPAVHRALPRRRWARRWRP
ncbi:MAG: MBL fold metallo-hydrolase [Natrialbaceae archaeon]|nr:MBL fold metallo-hydrolase [Natrialbaceae archaeon]